MSGVGQFVVHVVRPRGVARGPIIRYVQNMMRSEIERNTAAPPGSGAARAGGRAGRRRLLWTLSPGVCRARAELGILILFNSEGAAVGTRRELGLSLCERCIVL